MTTPDPIALGRQIEAALDHYARATGRSLRVEQERQHAPEQVGDVRHVCAECGDLLNEIDPDIAVDDLLGLPSLVAINDLTQQVVRVLERLTKAVVRIIHRHTVGPDGGDRR